ncbi:TetR/AcrR family transcriptional regulator [Membranihabitans maritimus]|uniref:TetR/AcrR family transcriptional regulator n=1 Tax=Membranihabitans maritimus TaxID=2904244 RepID=UPI001F2E0008|nr:TetR/AcrR family transcriptional regulator [Membranihabitans maritimus]
MARKIPKGEFRNKERTKLKLINAVGEVIRTQGYTKLGVNNIAKTAGVSKKLIYRYFGSADDLVATYVRSRDYWTAFSSHLSKELAEQHQHDHGKDFLTNVFKNLFEDMSEDSETQKIILWEISEKSKLMSEISEDREKFGGGEIFAITDPFFAGTDVDIRAICGLLLGGTYYLVLYSNTTGGSFCGIEIDTENRKTRLFNRLDKIIKWA